MPSNSKRARRRPQEGPKKQPKKQPTSLAREGNLSVRAADQIRAQIVSGALETGHPLRERELSESLGISRIPLREALRRLEAERLVTIRPNRGAVVARISSSELVEIAEACRLLECHVLTLAIPRLRVENLDRAEACLERLDVIEEPFEWARANWRFHTTLYGAADRPLLLELLSTLRARAERAMLMLVADAKRRKTLNHEHRALLKLVRKKQTARARALLDAHLQGGKEEVMRLIRSPAG